MASEETIRQREDRLLANDRLIRGAWLGARFLCVFSALGSFLVGFVSKTATEAATRSFILLLVAIVFVVIILMMGEKLKHIRTIRRYREILALGEDAC